MRVQSSYPHVQVALTIPLACLVRDGSDKMLLGASARTVHAACFLSPPVATRAAGFSFLRSDFQSLTESNIKKKNAKCVLAFLAGIYASWRARCALARGSAFFCGRTSFFFFALSAIHLPQCVASCLTQGGGPPFFRPRRRAPPPSSPESRKIPLISRIPLFGGRTFRDSEDDGMSVFSERARALWRSDIPKSPQLPRLRTGLCGYPISDARQSCPDIRPREFFRDIRFFSRRRTFRDSERNKKTVRQSDDSWAPFWWFRVAQGQPVRDSERNQFCRCYRFRPSGGAGGGGGGTGEKKK